MNFDDINWDEFEFELDKDKLERLGYDFEYHYEIIVAQNNNISPTDFRLKLLKLFMDYSTYPTQIDQQQKYINIEKGFGIMDTIQTVVYTITIEGSKSRIDKIIDHIKTIPLQHFSIPLKTSCQRLE